MEPPPVSSCLELTTPCDASARCAAAGEAADGVVKKIEFLAERGLFSGLRIARQVEVPLKKNPTQSFVVEDGSV